MRSGREGYQKDSAPETLCGVVCRCRFDFEQVANICDNDPCKQTGQVERHVDTSRFEIRVNNLTYPHTQCNNKGRVDNAIHVGKK